MGKRKRKAREAFRQAVFERDDGRCRKCGEPAVDAHHITDRHLFDHGGYVLENGIAFCANCHLKAEASHLGYPVAPGFQPDELYALIKSSKEKAFKADLASEGRPL